MVDEMIRSGSSNKEEEGERQEGRASRDKLFFFFFFFLVWFGLFTLGVESSDTMLAADRPHPHVQHVRPLNTVSADEMGIVSGAWLLRTAVWHLRVSDRLTGWRHTSGVPGAQAGWSCLLVALKQLSNIVG
jgi:hypothetical protein